jgi:lipopolysaccharide biosynthesis glycosyltransferase/Tfp pilus assembly protein PilF
VLKPQNKDYRFKVAETLYVSNKLEEARAYCCEILLKEPCQSPVLLLLGTIECKLDDFASASHYFEIAIESDPENFSLREKIAKALGDMGRTEAAAEVYRKVLAQGPQQDAAIRGLVSILRKQKKSPAALEELQAIAAKLPENVDVRLAIGRLLHSWDRLDEARSEYNSVLEHSPGNVEAVLGLADVARTAAELELALYHFQQAASLEPHHAGIRFNIARMLFDLLRREEAESVVQQCSEDPLISRDPHYQTAKFEYFCKTLQFDRAKEAASCWPTDRDIPAHIVGTMGSLYAVLGQWRHVIALLRERAADGSRPGPSESYEKLFEAVSRAARQTGRYEEVLALIECWPNPATRAMATALRDQLVEEMLLLQSLRLASAASPKAAPRFESALRTERHARRTAILSVPGPAKAVGVSSRASIAVQHGKARPTDEGTIFYCTDAKYLIGAAVSLFSLLRNNIERNWKLVVYCSHNAIGFASQLFEIVAAHFGASIDVRNAAALLPGGAEFRTIRSMTGLSRLSEAAYFRLYAALQLIREKGGRALYIDCDTCVGSGIDELLDFNFAGQPMAAWWEPLTRIGARQATKRHGIVPGKYFNSGVLLFDLTNPQLEAALHRSLDVALNQQHLLIFLDQDCLNIGFNGLTVRLPDKFNFFVEQRDDVASCIRPVVTHFIAHPKPWDPCYGTRNCIPWFDEFFGLGELVGPELTRQLLWHHFSQKPAEAT